jgi:phosphoribosylformylglycinamidine cyclo-ligase
MTAKTVFAYRDAGVDIDRADAAKKRIKALARQTFTPEVVSEIGTFGGLFRLKRKGTPRPILVSSVDGVGTKLKIAFATGIHHTVGRDLVAHCVNDILVQGAAPLFFMDYIATHRMEPEVVARVVEGIAAGCRESECALLGGETAEMPGFYSSGEYDLAGFIVGLVDQSHLVDGQRIRPGDAILGLASTGLHTNGYSLARKLLFEVGGYEVGTRLPQLTLPLGEELLQPHRSYLSLLKPLLDRGCLNGLAHITGGGLTDNLPRILPDGCSAHIQLKSWPEPPIFGVLQQLGRIDAAEMLRTFNMGIGMALIVSPGEVPRVEEHLAGNRETLYRIGEIRSGNRRVHYRH